MSKQTTKVKSAEWPKDLRVVRDEYVAKLYNSDLFDRKTIQNLVKDRFGRIVSIITIDRIIKKS